MAEHPDSDALLSAVIPFAQQLLAKHGEFFPFGASLLIEGKIGLVEGAPGSEHPRSQEVIDIIYSGIAQQAKEGKIRGSAVCYDSQVIPPNSTKKTDAICIELQHPSEGCAKCFLPYHKGWSGSVRYGELFGVGLEQRVFV